MAKITGNRFEASTTPAKKLVDINDRKQKGVLTLLTLSDIQELRDYVDRLLVTNAGNFKPFDLKNPKQGKTNRINNVTEEDARELLELMDKLEQTMVPI